MDSGRDGGGPQGQRPAGGIVAAQTAAPPPDGVPAVEMAPDEDGEAGTGAAAALLRNLQAHAVQA